MIDSETLNQIMQHIATLNDDYTKISISLAILTERVEWLCKFFWLIVAAVIGMLVSQLYQIRLMHKNGKQNNKNTP